MSHWTGMGLAVSLGFVGAYLAEPIVAQLEKMIDKRINIDLSLVEFRSDLIRFLPFFQDFVFGFQTTKAPLT